MCDFLASSRGLWLDDVTVAASWLKKLLLRITDVLLAAYVVCERVLSVRFRDIRPW